MYKVYNNISITKNGFKKKCYPHTINICIYVMFDMMSPSNLRKCVRNGTSILALISVHSWKLRRRRSCSSTSSGSTLPRHGHVGKAPVVEWDISKLGNQILPAQRTYYNYYQYLISNYIIISYLQGTCSKGLFTNSQM